jgi:NADH-quinone oxidoreductase subunit I
MAFVVARRELTWWENLYIGEIVRGVWITSRHFLVNLTRHAAHAVGLMRDKPALVTFQYPEERRPLAPRKRTRHRLTKRADGSPRCVACMMCETVCPALCIYIVAKEVDNPNIEKAPQRFDIDLGKCVFCGYCVEACPEDAIRMDTGILEISELTRGEMILDMQTMLASSPTPATDHLQPGSGH